MKAGFICLTLKLKKMKITTLYFKANFTLQKFNNILLESRLIGGCLFSNSLEHHLINYFEV